MSRLLLVVSVLCVSVAGFATGASDGRTTEEGLIGYWNFDEGQGQILNDISGNNHRGTIRGAKWVQGVKGTALEFGGDDDGVEIAGPRLDGMAELTVEMWIKVKGSGVFSPLRKREAIYRFITPTILLSPRKTMAGTHPAQPVISGPWKPINGIFSRPPMVSKGSRSTSTA